MMTFAELDWNVFFQPLWLSLKVSFIASVISLLAGTIVACYLYNRTFFGKTIIETVIMLPLVLPPTIIGFLLLIALGRRSWLGRLAEWLFSQQIIFSWHAAVIAAVVVSFPLIYQTIKVGLSAVPRELEDAARLDGADQWQVLRKITLPLTAPSLFTGYILGFSRGLGEFGATLMIAGNIPGKTQTIPTAIYAAVETNQMLLAWMWTFVIIIIAFSLLFITRSRAG